MNTYNNSLLRFYRFVLKLCPPLFRKKYSEEMLLVFQMQLDNTPNLNFWQANQIFWSELRPIPKLLITAHLHERKKLNMKTTINRWFMQEQGSWKESALAILPVLIMGALVPPLLSLEPSLTNLPPNTFSLILLFLTLTLIIIGLVGAMIGFPRWTMMYLGSLLSVISYVSLFFVITRFPPDLLLFNWHPLLSEIVYLIVWFSLIISFAVFFLWIVNKLSIAQKLNQQIQKDPSLISLMLYGSVFFVILLFFYRHSDISFFQILYSLIYALGAWAYLRARKSNNRIAPLITATLIATIPTLAVSILLVDNFIIRSFSISHYVFYILFSWLLSLAIITIPSRIYKRSVKKTHS